jgi:hypothetical protein
MDIHLRIISSNMTNQSLFKLDYPRKNSARTESVVDMCRGVMSPPLPRLMSTALRNAARNTF